jgi:hypothetical protein
LALKVKPKELEGITKETYLTKLEGISDSEYESDQETQTTFCMEFIFLWSIYILQIKGNQ